MRQNIDVDNVDMIIDNQNRSMMANSLNVSQVSVQIKVEDEDEDPELGPTPASQVKLF